VDRQARHLEWLLALSLTHAVGPSDEFGRGHAEAAIDQVFPVSLRDHNIILLTQKPNHGID